MTWRHTSVSRDTSPPYDRTTCSSPIATEMLTLPSHQALRGGKGHYKPKPRPLALCSMTHSKPIEYSGQRRLPQHGAQLPLRSKPSYLMPSLRVLAASYAPLAQASFCSHGMCGRAYHTFSMARDTDLIRANLTAGSGSQPPPETGASRTNRAGWSAAGNMPPLASAHSRALLRKIGCMHAACRIIG